MRCSKPGCGGGAIGLWLTVALWLNRTDSQLTHVGEPVIYCVACAQIALVSLQPNASLHRNHMKRKAGFPQVRSEMA